VQGCLIGEELRAKREKFRTCCKGYSSADWCRKGQQGGKFWGERANVGAAVGGRLYLQDQGNPALLLRGVTRSGVQSEKKGLRPLVMEGDDGRFAEIEPSYRQEEMV